MTKNRPRCPVCKGEMKKNGTTSKGTTRWRCKNPNCGASTIKTRSDLVHKARFSQFYAHTMGKLSIAECAAQQGVSARTLHRYFRPYWLIDIPNTPDPARIYDQIFIDGTYTKAGCLLVATSHNHVLCWHWCKHETTRAYKALLRKLAPPLCVVLDGGQGAYSAIKQLWPHTRIQRCLIHAQRVVRRYVTNHPRTEAGKAISRLARRLPLIRTLEQAAQWTVMLHEYGRVYRDFLNEKTVLPKERNPTGLLEEYTHLRVRKAYNSLINLSRRDWLFTYLRPSENALEPETWRGTTNALEGGINAQLKRKVLAHSGRGGEHQRRMLEWWLYSKTQLPDDPLEIARQCNFGQDQLAKVSDLEPEDINKADQETGRPAFYDKAIPTEYNHSVGIRKGWLGR